MAKPTIDPLMQRFYNELAEWSQATFGPTAQRGPVGPIRHLIKEATEAELAMKEPEGPNPELIDCLFLVFDAWQRTGKSYYDLMDAAFDKLDINRQRHWPTAGDPTMPVEHDRGRDTQPNPPPPQAAQEQPQPPPKNPNTGPTTGEGSFGAACGGELSWLRELIENNRQRIRKAQAYWNANVKTPLVFQGTSYITECNRVRIEATGNDTWRVDFHPDGQLGHCSPALTSYIKGFGNAVQEGVLMVKNIPARSRV